MISDTVAVSLITGTLALVSTIFTGMMTFKLARLNTKVDSVKKTGEANHVLQNSSALAQLKLTALSKRANAVLMRRIAVLTTEQGDSDAADAADLDAVESEKLFSEHEKKQAVVDALAGKDPANVPA